MSNRNVWVEIDLAAIRHNVTLVKQLLTPGVKLCAVVKADAYGHGAVPVAKAALEVGADFLAVALYQEALELRQAGIKAPLLILGALQEEYAEGIVAADICQAVFSLEAVQALSVAAAKLRRPARVHVAVETGMNRIGVDPGEIASFVKAAAALPGIEINGCFSHFASADDVDKTFCTEQLRRFNQARQAIKDAGVVIPIFHIANSAAIAAEPSLELNMVRQGITLYGLKPADLLTADLSYRPAMCLKAKVVHVKEIRAGETVGYGRSYTAEVPRIIATLPLGYADGISRKLSNRGQVLLRGKRAQIVGKVCMDQLMLDVTDIPGVRVGDEAVLFGKPELPAEKVADWQETITYEVVCGISKRVPRVYIN